MTSEWQRLANKIAYCQCDGPAQYDSRFPTAAQEAINSLDEQEQSVIKLRCGLGKDQRVYTLKEVAEKLNLKKERVRQIEARAIRKLRWRLQGMIVVPPPPWDSL